MIGPDLRHSDLKLQFSVTPQESPQTVIFYHARSPVGQGPRDNAYSVFHADDGGKFLNKFLVLLQRAGLGCRFRDS